MAGKRGRAARPEAQRLRSSAARAGGRAPREPVSAAHPAAALLALGCLLAALSSSAFARGPAPRRAAAERDSTARPSGEATAPRPSFLLPDVVIEGSDLSRFVGGRRLLDPVAPVVEAGPAPALVHPGETHYRRRVGVPFEASLPPLVVDPVERGRVRALLSDGATRELGAYWSFSPANLAWLDLVDRRHRTAGRRHRGADAGYQAADASADPSWRGRASVELRDESWEPARDYAWKPSDGSLAWRVRGSLEAGGGILGERATLTGLAAVAGVEMRAARGGWQSLDLRVRRRGPVYDLRVLAAPDRSLGAISRFEFDLLGGIVRQRNMRGEQTDGRLRGRAGFSTSVLRGLLTLGIAGGAEGWRGILGPWLAWRCAFEEPGLLVAVEAAPTVHWFDEWWGSVARLAPPALLGPEPEEERMPFAAQILDPLQPPQRAWPRLALEVWWARPSGALRAEAVLARVHDPFDWTWSSAAGTRLPATSHNEARRMTEIRVRGERRLGADLIARGEYHWVRDGERDPRRRLLLLPEHRVRAALGWEPGEWLAQVGLESRGRSLLDRRGARLAGYPSLSVHLGRSLGAHTLALVGENLLNETVEAWPGEVLDERWFGIEWRWGRSREASLTGSGS